MKKFRIILLSIILIIVLYSVFLIFKFKNVEVELGNPLPQEEEFIRYGIKSGITCDLSNVNLEKVGEYPVKLKYLLFSFNSKVTVVDTTAPLLETENVYQPLNYVFNIDDFVTKIEDKSEYSLSYEGTFDTSNYGEYNITINKSMKKD